MFTKLNQKDQEFKLGIAGLAKELAGNDWIF
jgi:hypothetical protein